MYNLKSALPFITVNLASNFIHSRKYYREEKARLRLRGPHQLGGGAEVATQVQRGDAQTLTALHREQYLASQLLEKPS